MTLQEIKELKKKLGYTNAQLAALSGVPLSTVQKVLGNTTSAPRYKTLRKLEEALTVNLRDSGTRGQSTPNPHPYPLYPQPGQPNRDFLLGETPALYRTDTGTNAEKQGKHTIQNYYALPEERRVELIEGVFYDMAAPDGIHQDILLILASLFRNHIRKNKGGCRVYIAPRDVQPDPDDDKTIVQPDIIIVCDRSKITARCILGAPDLIVEILSPSSRERDLHLKAAIYANSGVREYWIIDPEKKIILVYRFTESRFPACYSFTDRIPVGIWDDRPEIDFSKFSEEIDGFY